MVSECFSEDSRVGDPIIVLTHGIQKGEHVLDNIVLNGFPCTIGKVFGNLFAVTREPSTAVQRIFLSVLLRELVLDFKSATATVPILNKRDTPLGPEWSPGVVPVHVLVVRALHPVFDL